jgi:hypothetical protein
MAFKMKNPSAMKMAKQAGSGSPMNMKNQFLQRPLTGFQKDLKKVAKKVESNVFKGFDFLKKKKKKAKKYFGI